MELIPSFQVDHTKIVPGIYESRVDEVGNDYVTTYDIRMKTPNTEPAIHPNAMHTIEHVVATFLCNDSLLGTDGLSYRLLSYRKGTTGSCRALPAYDTRV